MAAVENLISAGAKGILMVASDTKAVVPVVEQARKAGILVIALDTPLEPADAADATFATDNFKAGELIGSGPPKRSAMLPRPRSPLSMRSKTSRRWMSPAIRAS